MNHGLRIFLPFAAGYFLSYLLRNYNAVIAPELTRELGLSAADLGLLTATYLLAFGAFQLPLGLLMDRYGPRRVEAVLLLVAATGCVVFALSSSLSQLVVARAAIGLGLSACLMASFTTFSRSFPTERLPSLNAAVMAAGGLGAISATTPLAWAMPVFGWRSLLLDLAGLAVMIAVGVLLSPEKISARTGEPIGHQIRALLGIMQSRIYWRYAVLLGTAAGGFIAVQGLWAVPWLMDVGGHSRSSAAFHLLLTMGAMTLSLLAIAMFIVTLRRRGVPPDRVLTIATGVGVLTMLGILLEIAPSHVLWFLVGSAFACNNLAYSQLLGHFPPSLAGRVNTTLNLAAFASAFAIQWGYGAVLDALTTHGWELAQAHRAAFGTLVALQAAGFGWFVREGRRAA